MAYVGTPSRLGSARDTLASIIQGEAGGEGLRGMQAVAQVISNRASLNFSGYGRDLVSQAVAPRQFQGQASRISPQAYEVADQALSGQLPNVVGSGAVNYANPGASTPGNWGSRLNSDNSFQLGNHYFTDNTRGVPYSPNLGANTNVNSNLTAPGTANGIPSDPTRGGNYYYNPSTGAITPTTDSNPPGTSEGFGLIDSEKGILYGSGTGPGVGQSGTSAAPGSFDSTGGFTTANAAGGAQNGSFGLGGVQSGGQTVGGQTGSPGGGTGASGGDPIVGYNSAGPVIGAPTVTAAINQSGAKVSGSVDKGAKQIGDDTKEAGKTIGQSVTGLASTVKGISDTWNQWASDTFLRLAFIIVGLVLFAAALWYFARPQVQQAAGIVADVIPAGRVAKAVGGLAKRRG